MDVSIVDIAPVREGEHASDAYRHTTRLARVADELGYRRFWVAEHHGFADAVASTTPPVLIAHLAQATESIRLGSGTVLLNHYEPFKVAETFTALEALAPGRIDLGLGRATGMPAADHALGSGPDQRDDADDHETKIDAVVRHVADAFPADHPYSDIVLPRSAEGRPEVWVLGSSPSSAAIAARLGLPYAFAAFIRPTLAEDALATYHDAFEASSLAVGLDEPHAMLAVNVACAPTDEAAARLRAPAEATYQRMASGVVGPPPTVEAAIDELGGVPAPTPTSLAEQPWPRAISGSPETVETLVTELVDTVGADEVIIQNLIEAPSDRVRSHELIAEALITD